MTFRAAFYKGEGKVYNRVVRLWERGPYSHGELIYSDGTAASASFMDGGVRFKAIDFNPDNWDFVTLPAYLETLSRQWFRNHEHDGYDLIGQFRFIVAPVTWGNGDDNWWCTEAMAASLGMADPWRYGPNGLFAALKFMESTLGGDQ
jgi:hypothetical protein